MPGAVVRIPIFVASRYLISLITWVCQTVEISSRSSSAADIWKLFWLKAKVAPKYSAFGLCLKLSASYPHGSVSSFRGQRPLPIALKKAFGKPLYVHLSRENKVAQAVSLLKAMQTGLWHIASDGSELERTAPHQEAAYDATTIRKLVDEPTLQDDAWSEWFVSHRIEPVRLTYDALSRDPQAGLRAVLSGLGVDTSLASTIMPRTAKLADKQNENWITRFQTDNS